MNEVSIFDFGDSPIRTLTINNKPYFVARDICLALGYVKPENAVKQHCRATLKQGIIDKLGREQEMTVIPESDLYRLTFKSELPAAQRFEEWVTDDVLPTLRQTGEYSLKKDEEIDDISLDYDAGNIQVAEFELRAIKVICQLFGRDAAKQAYMSSKYLPKPIYAIDGKKDASAISCLEYLKTMFVSNYPITRSKGSQTPRQAHSAIKSLPNSSGFQPFTPPSAFFLGYSFLQKATSLPSKPKRIVLPWSLSLSSRNCPKASI